MRAVDSLAVRALVLKIVGALALVGLSWMLLTSAAPGSSIANWAPCPRNWSWVDAWRPRTSPLAAASIRFSRGHAKVCYGRPSLRGRTMLGGDAVPFGQLWRFGANEPTTLHLDVPAELGEVLLTPGSYSLYAVPEPDRWTIVVNRSTRQWGLEQLYDEEIAKQEVGRFSVRTETLTAPVETFTIRPLPAADDHWTLVVDWQTTRIRVPLVATPRPRIDEEELPLSDDPYG